MNAKRDGRDRIVIDDPSVAITTTAPATTAPATTTPATTAPATPTPR
jgi:hypothetical protein